MNLIDLTDKANDNYMKKYYCAVLWARKPFRITTVIISNTQCEMFDNLTQINQYTNEFCAKKLKQYIGTQNSRGLDKSVYFEDDFNGLYVTLLECLDDEYQKIKKINDIIKYIDFVYSYDPTYNQAGFNQMYTMKI